MKAVTVPGEQSGGQLGAPQTGPPALVRDRGAFLKRSRQRPKGEQRADTPECSMLVSGAALKWRLCPELGDQDGEEVGSKNTHVHTLAHSHTQHTPTYTGTHTHTQGADGLWLSQSGDLEPGWLTPGKHAVQRPHAPFGAGRPGFCVPRDTRDPVDHSKPHPLLTQDP